MKPIKRALAMAAAIGVDGLLQDANSAVQEELFSILDGQLAQHKIAVEKAFNDILTADMRRITASRLTATADESTYEVAADAQTVDDAFRGATRTLGAAIAQAYAKRLALAAADDEEDFDIYSAKARVAAVVRVPTVLEQVDAAADQIVVGWFDLLHARIKGLSEERRSVYSDLKQHAREPQEVDLVVPKSRIENTRELRGDQEVLLDTRDRHLLSNNEGEYPIGKLNPWEVTVVDTEMVRDEAVAWYRNPSSPTKDSLQVPWLRGKEWTSMQPDFLFFSTKADGTLVASIVDPHSSHLADALGKLRGLAVFAEEYGNHFLRIEAVAQGEGEALQILDLTDPKVRQIAREAETAKDAYRSAGQAYH